MVGYQEFIPMRSLSIAVFVAVACLGGAKFCVST